VTRLIIFEGIVKRLTFFEGMTRLILRQ